MLCSRCFSIAVRLAWHRQEQGRLLRAMASKPKGKGASKSSVTETTSRNALPPYIKEQKQGGCTLALHVKPNAKESAITSSDGRLNLAIHAPPRDGEANEEVVRYVAEVLGLRKSQVRLVAGHKSREKVVSVDEVDAGKLLILLYQALPGLDAEKSQATITSFFGKEK